MANGNIFDILYGAGAGLFGQDNATGMSGYAGAIDGAIDAYNGNTRNPLNWGYGSSPTQEQPKGQPVQEANDEAAREFDAIRKGLAMDEAKLAARQQAFDKKTSGYMDAQRGFQEGGLQAFEAQKALAGMLGPEAQQAAIAQIESSPQYQAMVQQGERGILANAAATGGVRGGNTQAALAQYRPQVLAGLIDQQYARLGGLSGLGAQTGQGLIGAGISREQAMLAAQMGLIGPGLELGVGAAQTRAGGKIGQTQMDLDMADKAEEKRRWDEQMKLNRQTAGLQAIGAVLPAALAL